MLIAPRDPLELRQGDLLKEIFFPIFKYESRGRFVGHYKSGAGDKVELTPVKVGPANRQKLLVETEASVGFAAVASQCCDVDLKQDPPPPSIVLCRVTPPPTGVMRNDQWLTPSGRTATRL